LLPADYWSVQTESKKVAGQVKAEDKDKVGLKSIYDWTVILLDAKSEKPLEGIEVDAQVP